MAATYKEPAPLRQVLTPKGLVILTREFDDYVLSGPMGRHSLTIATTDDARLDAHWNGFVQNHGGEKTRIAVVTRTNWNGSVNTFTGQVLGPGREAGTLVVACRFWKSSDEVRIQLVSVGRSGLSGRPKAFHLKMWTHGKAPKWVKALAEGTNFEPIA